MDTVDLAEMFPQFDSAIGTIDGNLIHVVCLNGNNVKYIDMRIDRILHCLERIRRTQSAN